MRRVSSILLLYICNFGSVNPMQPPPPPPLPLGIFTLTHLILVLRYCALGTFPTNSFTLCGPKYFDGGLRFS